MAYGTPNGLDEIEPYYTDIRGGRKPSPENLKELVARYQSIGGRTPLLDITRVQASALQAQLGDGFRVYVGMKHWHPYIAAAVDEIVRNGHRSVIALALAPHYSRFSIDGYVQRVRDAIAKSGASLDVTFVESWNDHPLFLRSIAERMESARQELNAAWSDIEVVFSAHSLPERILQSNDPYPRELRETCEGVAALIGLPHWRFAYQSAGRTGEKWLGPDILDTLDEIAKEKPCEGAERKPSRGSRVLVAPIGFVADHLEVLYDIDVECADRARSLGIEMRRIESPNASPTFIRALAAIVRERC
ncbi:MAG: ferrochelatase [Chloroflexota bacterium]|nr:ferrochelatase [Chloroflexota bacterium]